MIKAHSLPSMLEKFPNFTRVTCPLQVHRQPDQLTPGAQYVI
jgi:hypothetical protein